MRQKIEWKDPTNPTAGLFMEYGAKDNWQDMMTNIICEWEKPWQCREAEVTKRTEKKEIAEIH